ncbi:hypothetical protein AVEN_153163-1 [Araneus ventricosus]|uniref:Uncharacterized protein n=1 Tax=Araneus ventricosus TaxID=182803 RepID=A0A4Y2UT61_ARAVE|nr:hypothetical protein AVEN_153163-1 [Araneus ventricosus]
MHRRSIETTNQSATVHSDPLLRILPAFKTTTPPAPISSEGREPYSSPHVSAPSAFQHLWPSRTDGVVRYPDWLEIITSAPRCSNSHRCFCTHDRICRGAV